MKKTAKILAFVFGVAYAIGVAGCGEKEKTYDIPRDQYGFVCKPVDYGCLPRETYKCAYRILEDEYDKNNVKIQVGYGNIGGVTGGPENYPETLTFRMYIGNADLPSEDELLIKEISVEEFLSEDYLVDGVVRSDGAIVYLFRHTEIVRIPEELFNAASGSISWSIVGYFVYEDGQGEKRSGSGFTVNYQMTGDKVVLSVPEHYFE